MFILLFLAWTASVPMAHAQDTPVSRVMLPVDQKLVDVAWRCPADGTCSPWFLTRLMGRKEATRSYTFSDGVRSIIVSETREPGNWPWERVRTMVLPQGQRLREIGWRCDRDGCEPWSLTVPFEGRDPRTHVFTDGKDVILVEERPLH